MKATANPSTSPLPTSVEDSARCISWPRSCVPMKAAMMTMNSENITDWLAPTSMVGKDIGGLDQFGRHIAKALDGVAHDWHGGKNHDSRPHGHVIRAKQHDDRDQIDEAWKGLRRVTDQQDTRRPCSVARRPDPQGQADQRRNENGNADHID